MLNDKKYKVPNKTSPDNQILFIVNGLEQKNKKLRVINAELFKACRCLLCDIEYLVEEGTLPKEALDHASYKQAQQAITKAEE